MKIIKKLQLFFVIGLLLVTFASNIVEPLEERDDPGTMRVELGE